MRVFNIPADRQFADTLVEGVLARHADPADPAALTRVEILLPTRRAQRAVTQAFLRASGGRPTLLPRMAPLGDLDDADMALSGLVDAEVDLAPAIAPLRRRLALARLVVQWSLAAAGDSRSRPAMAVDQAVRLAAQLTDLLDEVQTQRLSFAGLRDLVPERYAVHWQQVLTFLHIVVEQWPTALAALDALDPIARRNTLVAARLAAWRAAPPAHPVIAAGSTGSIPATADLLHAVAGFPDCAVVLPGLDSTVDEQTWQHVGPSHPQYGLAELLSRLGIVRADVTPWRTPNDNAAGAANSPPLPLFAPAQARQHFLSEAMRPAETTQDWAKLGPIPATALDRVTYIPCPSDREESTTIALIMREVLEQHDPPRTCALITPDRKLARRVAAALRRWQVTVDDSAGIPLHHTTPVTFLRLCIDVIVESWAPLPVLALLKHPLAGAGMDPADLRSNARRLERAILRGPRPAPGIAGVRAALDALAADPKRRDPPPALYGLLDRLAAMSAPVAAFFAAQSSAAVDPAALLHAHLAFAEALAATPGLPGPARLWSADAGESAAQVMAEMADALAGVPAIPADRYPALFDALLDGVAVRPRHGGHARLAILGLLEARMQSVDVAILGGLNEGTWPPQPATDPWMSRQMRRDFGLPDTERRIGLAAHDFVQAFAAPIVVLTRAERVDGAPTVPARWLTRMQHVATQAGLALSPSGIASGATPGAQARTWRYWQRSLDRTEDWAGRVQRPPAPCPPVTARPRQLAVTHIQRWMRNPYDIYARHVLRLRQLDAIDEQPRASHYGSVIHGVLDAVVSRYPSGPLPRGALAELLALGEAAFAPFAAHPSVHAFWWPRFERIARWFIDHEAGYRTGVARSVTERTGRLTIDAPAGPFTLTAKADRIDVTHDGTLRIVDYKTGEAPAPKDIDAGLEPQLSLEAAIAAAGGFAGVPAAVASDLVYWSLRGGHPAGEEKPINGDPAALAAEALAGLTRLVAAFDDPATAYHCRPRAAAAPRFDDYAHLARVKEWASGEDVS